MAHSSGSLWLSVADPLWPGATGAGVFRSVDAGDTWKPANRGLLPWPSAGVISLIDYNSNSSLRSLQSQFTKRMSNRWQMSATYTLSWFYDQESQPVSGRTLVPFAVADDLGGDGSYGLAATDQRHRAVLNGIWEVSHGFQVSALHYFGAGIRSATTFGGDVRQTGGTFSARLRPDGTLVPRNASRFALARGLGATGRRHGARGRAR